ncbi:MAG TPA: LapA family protein [Allosphingosinicella sp.]|nr:LapA family protein [Allosphingosinicella sp.]
MQFLKTLFWVALAVLLVLFASVNWNAVTITLWGGLEADVKLPILILFAFLLGFLPTLIVHRARLWSLKRRLEAHERQIAVAHPTLRDPAAPAAAAASEQRIATDSKAWPAK